MKEKTLQKKTLCFLLVILFVLGCFPVSATALEANTSSLSESAIMNTTPANEEIVSADLEELKNRAPDEKIIFRTAIYDGGCFFASHVH